MWYDVKEEYVWDGVVMEYKVYAIKDNMIYIQHNYRDELDGFIMLLKSIEGELDGRIIQIDSNDVQYMIDRDPYGLVYRWDTKEGIVVVMQDAQQTDEVLGMLQYHFDKLNY